MDDILSPKGEDLSAEMAARRKQSDRLWVWYSSPARLDGGYLSIHPATFEPRIKHCGRTR
jgi:hypothetical protein